MYFGAKVQINPRTTAKEWPSQSPNLNPIENVGRPEKACASKEAYKPDSVTPALSGGMGQNSPNLLWEACERLTETFDQS